MELFTIKDINFEYPSTSNQALRNINTTIESGDFVVIYGASGSGKSTLLRLLKKSISPKGKKQGKILYKGKDILNLSEKQDAQEIGFIFQQPEKQIITDRVYKELAFTMENLGYSSKTIHKRIAEMSSFFGIEDLFEKKTNSLSGGQKQLINLASVMSSVPEVILLDEPTSQLDPIAASTFIDTLRKINQELSITIIIVEHRLEELMVHANKMIILDKGEILFDHPPRLVSKKFIGNPMFVGFPMASRLYEKIPNLEEECPITINEGKRFFETYINKNYTHENQELYNQKSLLVLKDLWFRYEREAQDVLKGISLELFEGEIFSIIGGNGSGKTTLLKVIAGIEEVYKGKLFYKDKRLYNKKSIIRDHCDFAYLPQNPMLLFSKDSLKQEIDYVAKEFSLSDNQIQEVIKEYSLEKLLLRHPADLSGGERQRAAFAKLSLLDAKVYLLDEPTKGMDPQNKILFAQQIKKLKEKEALIILVTHDLDFVAEYSDRCSLIFRGEMQEASTPSEFFSQNYYYTTAASRISRNRFQGVVSSGELLRAIEQRIYE